MKLSDKETLMSAANDIDETVVRLSKESLDRKETERRERYQSTDRFVGAGNRGGE
jgi:hypothetical protein